MPNYFSGGLIYTDLLVIFLYTLVAMGFRFWSLRVEESRVAAAPRMTIRRALLLYSLNALRAHLSLVDILGLVDVLDHRQRRRMS